MEGSLEWDILNDEKPCLECGIVDILDDHARLCYECLSLLDLKAAEEEE